MTNRNEEDVNFNASSDEISLSDLWQTLVRRKRWVFGSVLFAATVAALAMAPMKPQWEATAAIQIGAVGQGEQAVRLIESQARVVARMKLKSFEDGVLASLKSTDPHGLEARLYRRSLRIKALANTDLIELKVRGYSSQSARRSAEATVAYLRKVHQAMTAPTEQRVKRLLARIEKEITQIKAEREKVLQIAGLKRNVTTEARFTENVLLANVMIQRDGELRQLEQAKMEHEEQLSSIRSYPTSYIEKISVSEEPVAPKRGLIILLAGVLGLLFGAVFAIFRQVPARRADK